MPLWHDRVPFVLITSQKAGSTLGAAWFFHHAGLLEDARAYHQFAHQYEQDVFLQKPDYMRGLEKALQSKPVYKLVREPGTRAYSSYLALMVESALDPADHRAVIRRRIEQSEGLGVGSAAPIPFGAYLSWLSKTDHQRLDGHEARQFNLYEDQLLPSKPEPIHLENVADSFRAIEQEFGLIISDDVQLADIGASTHYAKKTQDPEAVATVMNEGIALPRRARVPEITTVEIARFEGPHKNLLTACGEDFRRYGYPTNPSTD